MNATPMWFRVAWLAVAGSILVVAALGLSIIYQRTDVISSPAFVRLLAEIGISLDLATTVSFVFPVAAAAVLATTVYLVRRNDLFALTFALGVLGFFVFATGSPRAIAAVVPRWAILATVVEVVALIPFILAFYLFPNGRFRPRGARWWAYLVVSSVVVLPWMPGTARMMIVDPENIAVGRKGAVIAVAVVFLTTGVANQVVRYRRVSTPVERQQMRWVLFGFLVVLLPAAGVMVGVAMGAERAVAWLLLVMSLATPVLPVTAAIAVLRFRLFELDRVISLTVSWATLSVLLAGFYLLSVIAFQTVLRPMTGDSDLAVAASTLAVAALFAPARRQIQRLVDRQFHRARYNAERTIERFSQGLRDQLDSGTLTRNLTDVAIDTFEPTRVSVWLRS